MQPLSDKQKNTILIALAIIVAVLFWYSAALQNAFYGAVEIIDKYMEQNYLLGASAFVGLAALSAFLSPFSSVPIVPAAVLLFGTWQTFVLLLSGWALGGIVGYGIGRYLGAPILGKFIFFKKINGYLNELPDQKEFGIILLFRLALPAEIPGYVLGILRFSFWKYILITLLAEAPFALITVYASEALVNLQPARFTALLVFGIVLFLGLLWAFKRKIKK